MFPTPGGECLPLSFVFAVMMSSTSSFPLCANAPGRDCGILKYVTGKGGLDA
jgi:hypothetical protein